MKKKKIVSLFVTFSMLLGLFPATAMATGGRTITVGDQGSADYYSLDNMNYVVGRDEDVTEEVFYGDVIITGADGAIAFTDCTFNGKLINRGGEGAVVRLFDCTFGEDAECIIDANLENPTLDSSVTKFMFFGDEVPAVTVLHDGAVVALPGRTIILNEHEYASEDAEEYYVDGDDSDNTVEYVDSIHGDLVSVHNVCTWVDDETETRHTIHWAIHSHDYDEFGECVCGKILYEGYPIHIYGVREDADTYVTVTESGAILDFPFSDEYGVLMDPHNSGNAETREILKDKWTYGGYELWSLLDDEVAHYGEGPIFTLGDEDVAAWLHQQIKAGAELYLDVDFPGEWNYPVFIKGAVQDANVYVTLNAGGAAINPFTAEDGTLMDPHDSPNTDITSQLTNWVYGGYKVWYELNGETVLYKSGAGQYTLDNELIAWFKAAMKLGADLKMDVAALGQWNSIAVTGVTLDKATLTLTAGGNETLSATVSPDNATNKAVAWTSSDTSVATVADGVVTAVAAGSATITATTADGGYTATCAVTVEAATEPVVDYGVMVAGISVTGENYGDVLSDGTVSYDAETNTLTLNNASITAPEGGYGIYANADLTIVGIGTNSITGASGKAGIKVMGGDLVLEGDFDTIQCIAADAEDEAGYSVFAVGNLTIAENAIIKSVVATGIESAGIATYYGDILIEGAVETIIADETTGTGILAGDPTDSDDICDVTITGKVTTITAGCPILAAGQITIVEDVDYVVGTDESVETVEGEIFYGDVIITGADGAIAFTDCTFNGKLINRGGEGAVVRLFDCTFGEDAECIIDANLENPTLDSSVTKFMFFGDEVPAVTVLHDGAVVALPGRTIILNEHEYASEDAEEYYVDGDDSDNTVEYVDSIHGDLVSVHNVCTWVDDETETRHTIHWAIHSHDYDEFGECVCGKILYEGYPIHIYGVREDADTYVTVTESGAILDFPFSDEYGVLMDPHNSGNAETREILKDKWTYGGYELWSLLDDEVAHYGEGPIFTLGDEDVAAWLHQQIKAGAELYLDVDFPGEWNYPVFIKGAVQDANVYVTLNAGGAAINPFTAEDGTLMDPHDSPNTDITSQLTNWVYGGYKVWYELDGETVLYKDGAGQYKLDDELTAWFEDAMKQGADLKMDVAALGQWTTIDVTGVVLNKSTLELTVGGSETLGASVVPENATDKQITWSTSDSTVATVDGAGKVTAVKAGTATITATAVDGGLYDTCVVTVKAASSGNQGGGDSGSGGGGGGSSSTSTGTTTKPNTSSPTVSTDTTTNTDGSTTVTETKKDGTTVETTTNTDGSSTTTASKTETTTNKDGSTTTTTATNTKTETADGATVTEEKVEKVEEAKDGTTVTTTTTKTETETASGEKVTVKAEEVVEVTEDKITTTTTTETKSTETGLTVNETKVEETVVDETTGEEITTSKTETKSSDGSKSTTTVDETGKTTAEVTLSTTAVNTAEDKETVVILPMPAVETTKTSDTAPTVTVDVPASADSVKVEIPVADVSGGTVAVIVHADGTEEIVKTSTITENGVVLTVEGDATVKIVDNSKDFTDVPETYTLSDSIDFVSARGLFEGNTETTFNPHANTSIAQTLTVLARLEGEDFYGAGSTTKGAEWGAENDLHDGSDVHQPITREQMVVMMWKLAGSPESDHEIDHHADDHLISDHALEAMQWAVEMGIIQGNLDGSLNPHGHASRAHVAAFSERYVNAI